MVLAGGSALTTAAAHAFLKAGRDKLAVQAWIRMIGAGVALPLAIMVGPPPSGLWPLLTAAAAVHAIYQLVPSWSYAASDFTAAYPVARGVAPVAGALGGIALLGDALRPVALAAIATITLGIIIVAAMRSLSRSALVAAIAAGGLTSVYSIVDAAAIRAAPSVTMFLAWFYLADGVAMPVLFAVRRPGTRVAALRRDSRYGVAAGVLALAAFVPALIAFRLAPVGIVSAIRETSIVGALVIGAVVLGEPVTRQRLTGAAAIVVGTLLLITGAS